MDTHTNIGTGTALPGSMLPIPGDNDDLLTPAAPPHAAGPQPEPMNVGAGDTDFDPTPAPRIMKPRDAAFADRVAQDRAKDMLGADYEPVVAGMKAAPKKVSEKAYNALCYLADRGKLSVFTSAAIASLKASTTLKSGGLVELFKGMEYSDKTARSQAQQQMMVLPILKIATRAGDTLTFQPGHMADLFETALTRPPAEKPAKQPRARKAKGAAAEELLAEAAPVVEDEPDTKPSHDTDLVEELLGGTVTTAPVEAEETPSPALSNMSPEDAIQAFAAQQFESETKAAAPKKKAAKTSKPAKSAKKAKKKAGKR
jgi:hypothetical protein